MTRKEFVQQAALRYATIVGTPYEQAVDCAEWLADALAKRGWLDPPKK